MTFILLTASSYILTVLWMFVRKNEDVMDIPLVPLTFWLAKTYMAILLSVLGVVIFMVYMFIFWIPHTSHVFNLALNLLENPLYYNEFK